MHRSRVVFLLMVLSFFCSFAQEDFGVPPMTDEERAARRAQFMQLMQERLGGGGGAPIDQAVTTQRPGEAAQLETIRQPAQTGSEVTVNWENVTLKDCIEVLCRDLGMEFVISPSVNVSQEVSVRAGDVTQWTVADKQELFDAILETAGVQRVQRGRVWVFSPSDIRPVVEAFKGDKYGDGKPVIGVIKLKSIDASQAEQFLNTVGGKPPRVFAMKGSRMVLVLGTQQFLSQMEELVRLIDFSPGAVTPYVLENASSDDMAKELAAIFYGRTGGDGESLRFISIARLNVVVAHNVPEGMIDEVSGWVEMLDRFDDQNDRATRVYRLQVIDAETIGKTLDSLYSTLYKQTQSAKKQASSTTAVAKGVKSGSSGAAKQTSGNASAKTGAAAAAAPKADSTPAKASGGNGSSQASPDMEEEAVILADKDTNTLIINATPDQHRDIERTIQELDRPRRQVLIETVLVEVTLDEGMDLGVEWALSKGLSIQGSVEQSFNRGNIPENNDGFSYLLSSSAEKLAFIQAAQNDDRLQVLSSPTVLTRDGMEATVSFGQEVPVQEKSTSGTSSTRDNYSYSYQDAKITLTVTPVIDDNKMVTLNLTQTLRQIPSDYTVEISGDNDVVLPPIFTTRELTSSLQVDNGQTLVLGGLIQREDQKVKRGIPLLSRIPVAGWLFGWNSTIKKGSEILMILTPRVVDTREDTDSLTREFREKILGAMSEKNIRQLYNLEEPGEPSGPKSEIPVPEAEGN
jgi:general secretion pathway protein D